MGTLSREDILARIAELPKEPLEVPELGGTVYIRVMTLREVREINRIRDANPKDPLAVYPKVILLGCCKEDGSPMFQPGDAERFNESMWPAADLIVKEVFYLNKIAARPKEENERWESDSEGGDAPKAEIALNGSR